MNTELFPQNELPLQTETPSAPKKRKNNPELLRHAIISAARTLIIQEGINNLSMQKVADLAGTSKGGLSHHFKSKDELLSAVIGLFIAQLNTAILAQIRTEMGGFTRAYAEVMMNDAAIGIGSEWAGLMRAINGDAQMRTQWQNWITQKLADFAATDSDAKYAIIRYGVDGAWLDDTLHHDEARRLAVYHALLAMF